MTTEPLRVMLADDHAMVRSALRSVLEEQGLTVVGEAADGRHAVALARDLAPDIAVLDVSMPELNGLEAAREILQHASGTRVVLLTMHADWSRVREAVQIGVSGYVLKTQLLTDLVQAIQTVARGGVYLSPGVSQAAVEGIRAGTRGNALTPREVQVLRLIAQGQRTKEIATQLGLTTSTAESYRERIMKKLNAHGTADLVRYAIHNGIIDP